ncbi:MAG: hypothetical protein ABJB17_00575 [Burkholderiales bacterium]
MQRMYGPMTTFYDVAFAARPMAAGGLCAHALSVTGAGSERTPARF